MIDQESAIDLYCSIENSAEKYTRQYTRRQHSSTASIVPGKWRAAGQSSHSQAESRVRVESARSSPQPARARLTRFAAPPGACAAARARAAGLRLAACTRTGRCSEGGRRERLVR